MRSTHEGETISSNILTWLAVLALVAFGVSCGGGGATVGEPDPGPQPPRTATRDDFTLTIEPETYVVCDAAEGFEMSVTDHPDRAVVRVDAIGVKDMHAIFASIDFDPTLFNPVAVLTKRLSDLSLPLAPQRYLAGANERGKVWLLDFIT